MEFLYFPLKWTQLNEIRRVTTITENKMWRCHGRNEENELLPEQPIEYLATYKFLEYSNNIKCLTKWDYMLEESDNSKH